VIENGFEQGLVQERHNRGGHATTGQVQACAFTFGQFVVGMYRKAP